MSMEGRVQSFVAAVKPLGECRPAWKVLRVLGNLLGLDGFGFDSSEQVKNEIFGGEKPSKVVWNRLNNNLRHLVEVNVHAASTVLQRVGEVPMYQSDAVVRRSPSLQKAGQSSIGMAGMNSNLMQQLGLQDGEMVRVRQDGDSIKLPVHRDEHVFDNCVRIPVCAETALLGDLYGEITVEKIA